MSMLVIELWAQGTASLLLNRATEEALTGQTRENVPGEVQDPRDVCEKKIYRLNDRQLALPGAAIARMLREAGGSHKAKGSRKSLKYIVPAAVIVLDDLIGLYLNDRKTKIKDFEVDSRPVTIPSTKGKVTRHRARLNEWSTHARIRINDQILSEDLVRKLMIEGLQQIGLGDFRPEKGGPFGTSDLVSWKIISDEKPKTDGQRRAAGREGTGISP
jgi:hypothetical protein